MRNSGSERLRLETACPLPPLVGYRGNLTDLSTFFFERWVSCEKCPFSENRMSRISTTFAHFVQKWFLAKTRFFFAPVREIEKHEKSSKTQKCAKCAHFWIIISPAVRRGVYTENPRFAQFLDIFVQNVQKWCIFDRFWTLLEIRGFSGDTFWTIFGPFWTTFGHALYLVFLALKLQIQCGM